MDGRSTVDIIFLPPPRRNLCDQCRYSFFLSFILSTCQHDYCKSNQPISLKLGVMIELANWKKWLTLGGDPFPDIQSGSLFHCPHHYGIEDFRRFICISDFSYSYRPIVTTLGEMIDTDEIMNPQHFRSDLAYIPTAENIPYSGCCIYLLTC